MKKRRPVSIPLHPLIDPETVEERLKRQLAKRSLPPPDHRLRGSAVIALLESNPKLRDELSERLIKALKKGRR